MVTFSRAAAVFLAVVLGVGLSAAPDAVAETVAGDFGGTVFADRNANGVRDAGENGLAGAVVSIFGGTADQRTTDAGGRFSFHGLPIGHYNVSYSMPDWIVQNIRDFVLVDSSGKNADVLVPAVRGPMTAPDASLLFDRETYQPGDTVRLKVVLINPYDNPINGVTAECSPGENGLGLRGAAGWGPLAAGGPGITIPAHRTTVVDVSEPMPDASPRWGAVTASCGFRTGSHADRSHAEDTARVAGVPTSQRGRIYQERDANGQFDDGEGIAGTTVVVTDQKTGAEVARASTDGAGGFEVHDVPAGVYDLRVAGPWKPPGELGAFEFQVVDGEQYGGNEFAVVPGSEPESRKPKLVATAVFAKPGYNSGDTIRVRISVTNIGTAAADGVHLSAGAGGPFLDISSDSMGDFQNPGPGARIEAGETRNIDADGVVWDPSAGMVIVRGWFEGRDDIGRWNNGFRAVARMTVTRGTYAGILFGDTNGNGVPDRGEAFGGVPIHLSGGVPEGTYLERTDPEGRFAFRDIPTGIYSAQYHTPAGWAVYQGDFVIDDQDHGQILIKAVRSLRETLVSSIKFTKGTYTVGETAHLTVSLTNRGLAEIAGLTALCVGIGKGNELFSEDGWGPLALDGPGVTLAPGTSKTFDVTGVVPEGAFTYGWVEIGCSFGNPPGNENISYASATAKVPGGIGTAGGRVIYDRNSDGVYDASEGVANTKVVLIDKESGRVVERDVTDSRGHYVFRDVRAYDYEFRVIGPWKVVDLDKNLQIMGGVTAEDGLDRLVIPGAVQPDPDASPVDGPAPQGGVAPPAARRLATTGASVIELSMVGLVVFVMGLAMVLVFARRRRA